MLIFKAVITIFIISVVKALSDPCGSIACSNPKEIPCIKLISGKKHATFKCECALNCDNVNIINVPIVQRIRPTMMKKMESDAKKPTLKQGGAACYLQPNYCMNGGTCYTQYTQPKKIPIQPVTEALPKISSSVKSRAISFNVTTTTTTTTEEPSTKHTYITKPVCGCQSEYSGERCQKIMTKAPTYPTSTTVSWNNLCRVYADRNMNICQHGGQCVFIADGKVACVCPSMFIGQYCETPVYSRCVGSMNTQCHRDFGTCQPDGSCLCKSGYTGMSCDQRAQETTVAPSKCLSYLCQNGGTCRQVSVDPYAVCICPSSYTGIRCETLLETSTIPPTDTTPSTEVTINNKKEIISFTRHPHCNFTIGVQNDGLYTSRFKVNYMIDGVAQKTWQSSNMAFVGQEQKLTIPHYAKGIMVTLERLGFGWSVVHIDTGITTESYCTKCYKMWGAVSNPKWAYLAC